MAITFANTTSGTGITGTSAIANKPINVSDGDVLVAIVYGQVSGSTIAAPAGWTARYTCVATGTRGCAVFTKPIPSASAETATNYTFTISVSGRWLIAITRMIGANSSPLDAAPTTDVLGANAVTIVDPSVTAVNASAMVMAINFTNDTASVTHTMTATGFVDLININCNNAGSTSSLDVSYKQLTNAGATGLVTQTLSSSAASFGGFLIAFAPAAIPVTGTVLSITDSTGLTSNSGTVLNAITDLTSGVPNLTTFASGLTGAKLEGIIAPLSSPASGFPIIATMDTDRLSSTSGTLTARLYEGLTLISTVTIPIPDIATTGGSGNGTAGTISPNAAISIEFPWTDVQSIVDPTNLNFKFGAALVGAGATVRFGMLQFWSIQGEFIWDGTKWVLVSSVGVSLPVTSSIIASGNIGKSVGSSLSATASITASGTLLTSALAITATITASGLPVAGSDVALNVNVAISAFATSTGTPLPVQPDSTTSIARINLFINPSFTYSTNGISTLGTTPPVISRDTTVFESGGVSSLKIAWAGTTGLPSAYTSPAFPTIPGHTYIVRYRQMANPGSPMAYPIIAPIVAGQAPLVPPTGVNNDMSADGTWKTFIGLFKANQYSQAICFMPNTISSNGTVTWIDFLLIEDYATYVQEPSGNIFFDGDNNGGIWLGTPGFSASSRTIPIHIAYTIDDAVIAFQSNGNTVRFTYERLDNQNNSLGFLTNVLIGAKIDYDYTALIKRSGSISAIDVDSSTFDFLSDRVRPWVGVQMPDNTWFDVPIGLFLVSSPVRHYEGGLTTRNCNVYDQTQVLIDIVPTNLSLYGGYSIAAGTLYTDAIEDILNRAGITDINLVESELALPTDRMWRASKNPVTSQQINDSTVWSPGANTAVIVNDLLIAINYGSLWFDGYGTCQCIPYVEPGDDHIAHTYATTDNSIIRPVVDQTLDLFSIPNVIVLAVSQPDLPQLTSIFVNSDPNSIVSTVSRGRRVIKFDNNQNVATQAELDALARRAAINAANVYETVTLSTMLMPNYGERDATMLVHSGLGISTQYAEMQWSMTLAPGGEMTHSMQCVVNIDASILGDPDAGS